MATGNQDEQKQNPEKAGTNQQSDSPAESTSPKKGVKKMVPGRRRKDGPSGGCRNN